MAHGIAGAAVAVTLDGGAWNIKVQEWELELKVEVAEDTAAGDAYVSRLPTFGDYDITLRGEVPDQAGRHLINAQETHFGTAIAFALKEKSGDSNGYLAGTALAHTLRIKTNLKGIIEAEVRLQSSEGVAPTFDTTPG